MSNVLVCILHFINADVVIFHKELYDKNVTSMVAEGCHYFFFFFKKEKKVLWKKRATLFFSKKEKKKNLQNIFYKIKISFFEAENCKRYIFLFWKVIFVFSNLYKNSFLKKKTLVENGHRMPYRRELNKYLNKTRIVISAMELYKIVLNVRICCAEFNKYVARGHQRSFLWTCKRITSLKEAERVLGYKSLHLKIR